MRPLETHTVDAIGVRAVQSLHGPAELPEYPALHTYAGQVFKMRLRYIHRLTPSEAAAQLGVDALTVYALFRGARTCDWAEVERRLADAREVSP